MTCAEVSSLNKHRFRAERSDFLCCGFHIVDIAYFVAREAFSLGDIRREQIDKREDMLDISGDNAAVGERAVLDVSRQTGHDLVLEQDDKGTGVGFIDGQPHGVGANVNDSLFHDLLPDRRGKMPGVSLYMHRIDPLC